MSVKPGYSVGLCSIELFEQINCAYAKQVYSRFVKKRYGVESCIEDEFDKYQVKKNLLDLNMIFDPNSCKPIPCLGPTNVSVSIIVYNPNYCFPPTGVSVSYEQPIIPCPAPSAILFVTLSYQ